MHLQELVDLLDLLPSACGDALLAAGLEDVGALALLPRHRIDDRNLTLEDFVVEVGGGQLVLHLGDARHHAHQAADAAHIRHLQKLLAHVVEVELPLAHLLGDARGLLGVDVGGGFFHQRDDVAHAENAPGNPAWVEIFQRVGFFTGADQLDRLAGYSAHRQRSAAAAITVHPRQHDAGEADALVKGSREVDRVLAGQGIRDQQHFMGIGRCFDLGGFRHHLFVERGAAGGVEQHHVIAAEFGGFQRALRNLRRLLAGDDR